MNFKAPDAVKIMKIAFILQHLLRFSEALEICRDGEPTLSK